MVLRFSEGNHLAVGWLLHDIGLVSQTKNVDTTLHEARCMRPVNCDWDVANWDVG